MIDKRFKWLIAMMLVSIVGITGIQIVWIRNAVKLRNESFNQAAIECVKEAAEAIERARKTNFVNKYMFQTPQQEPQPQDETSSYITSSSYFSYGDNVSISSTTITQRMGEEPVIVSSDTVISLDQSKLILASPEEPGKMTIVDPNEVNPVQSGSYLRQKEYIDWIENRANEFLDMSDQMISEIYQWEKTMELDDREIDFALQRSFHYSGITTPFEYAIIKDGEVTGGQYKKAQKNDFLRSLYIAQLFPENIFREDVNLAVVFPERNNYVLGSMMFVFAGSMVFSLIILATFAFSLYFIMHQKKMSEMKNDFINNMTHEFKTPIATISLAADTITNPKVIRDEYRVRQFISMIKKENSRMNKKVETILQIASLDNKEIDFKFDKVSLHSIIEKAVDSIEILIGQRNGTIKLNLNAPNPFVFGDADHLFNLVNNLLDNAIKYSPEAPEITVETKNNEIGVMIIVEDKGIGMSKSVQNKVFERFYRQTSGNIHNVKGFGLGLNYVRSIVDAHRGTVTVSSEPGKGSRFEVFLPFNEDNEPPMQSKSRY